MAEKKELMETKEELEQEKQYQDVLLVMPDKDKSLSAGYQEPVLKAKPQKLMQEGKEITIYELYNEKDEYIGRLGEDGTLELSPEYLETIQKRLGERKIYLNPAQTVKKIDLEKQKELELPEEKEEEETKPNQKRTKEEDSKEFSKKQIEEDLNLPEGDIISCTEIVDQDLREELQDSQIGGKRIGIGYSASTHSFIAFIQGKDSYEPIQQIKPSRATTQEDKVIDIGNDGNIIEEQMPTAILETNTTQQGKPKVSLAVKIGNYNELQVKRLEYDKYGKVAVASDVETLTQHPTTREVDEKKEKVEEIEQTMQRQEELGEKVDISDIPEKSVHEKLEEIKQEASQRMQEQSGPEVKKWIQKQIGELGEIDTDKIERVSEKIYDEARDEARFMAKEERTETN